MSSVVSVRINEREAEVLKHAASIYGCAVSSLLKKLAFEKLEDDFDLKVIKQYELEKRNGTLETRPAEEVFAELGV